ncbi:MAG: hypothetical protein AAF732_24235 [Pseudomonadota bacterium]
MERSLQGYCVTGAITPRDVIADIAHGVWLKRSIDQVVRSLHSERAEEPPPAFLFP